MGGPVAAEALIPLTAPGGRLRVDLLLQLTGLLLDAPVGAIDVEASQRRNHQSPDVQTDMGPLTPSGRVRRSQ